VLLNIEILQGSVTRDFHFQFFISAFSESERMMKISLVHICRCCHKNTSGTFLANELKHT